MKPFGIPIIYVVIAVGVLGVVTFSYVFLNTPAVLYDDTLKCQRSYNFSQVKFSPEARVDWEKCYMPEPLYKRRGDGSVYCVSYPEESCSWCAATLAIKYNDSNYCDLIRVCGMPQKTTFCKDYLAGKSVKSYVELTSVNISILRERIDGIYPQGAKKKN